MGEMQLIEYLDNPPRLYIGRKTKRHVHHFWHGVWMIGIGVVLIWTDRHDRPWAFIDDRELYVTRNKTLAAP